MTNFNETERSYRAYVKQQIHMQNEKQEQWDAQIRWMLNVGIGLTLFLYAVVIYWWVHR